MFKLLTEESKLKVSQEYAARRAVLIMVAVIVVLIVWLVGILPTFLLTSAKNIELSDRVEMLSKSPLNRPDSDPTLWLKQMKTKLQTLSPALDNVRPSDFIEKVITNKSAGVRLTSFSWNKQEGNANLSISGVAQDRQSLISFENNLNSSGSFSDVTLPVSNLAKDKDINFQMKLVLLKK